MRCRLREIRFAVSEAEARLPFRFGIATMTRAPLLVAEVVLEADNGTIAHGHAADTLVTKWFDKNPRTTHEEDLQALLASARTAAGAWLAAGAQAQPLFSHWWTVEARVPRPDPGKPSEGLVRGFGIALVERAAIDAACRAGSLGFRDALRTNFLGIDFGRFAPGLDDFHPRELPGIAGAAPTSIRVRHTIGLADPLRRGEVPAEHHRDDGHPECLEDDVRRYGLRSFKIKLQGRRAADLARLEAVWSVVTEAGITPIEVTLDGNENFADADELLALFGELAARPFGAALLRTLCHLEQPLPRGSSFDAAAARAVRELLPVTPCIIDEADGDPEAFRRALDAGYRGISVKSCKGSFRALGHAAQAARLRARGLPVFQSAEDLTCLPVVGLQEDLALDLAVGLAHTERNGHHYFAGLDHLPAPERERALAVHPDLYAPGPQGPRLRIRDGALSTTSLLASRGFGHDVPPDLALRSSLDFRPSARS